MELSGEYRIPAAPETVWAKLVDPAALKDCIPGCQSVEQTGENQYAAVVTAKIGPVKATFNGQVTLSDFDPPKSYRIAGEGKGGAAGFGKGTADVTLEPDGAGGTILRYTADAQVGGKMAQLGARLIQGTVQKLADEFFAKFAELAAASEPATPAATPAAAPATADTPQPAPQPDRGAPVSPAAAGMSAGISPAAAAMDIAGHNGHGHDDHGHDDHGHGHGSHGKGANPVVWLGALVVVSLVMVLLFG
ncbi:MAG: carbon monoxide dehydrogenase [Tistrella sp.]|nr:carbon monoxide dehydrogenase subunit G [Tistrella sp.]MAD36969.1 carbon monoxide dehydrogenase [Tistrella sp.]MBA79152.1 carbon monoxide dehydrogenase [Tistrella sp.]